MKKIYTLLFLILSCFWSATAQNFDAEYQKSKQSGDNCLNKGDYNCAIQAYQRAINIRENDVYAKNQLNIAKQKQKEIVLAEQKNKLQEAEKFRLAQQKKIEQAKKQEENRLAEQAIKAEENRLAEQAKKQEENRLAEQAKKQEENRLAEQTKKQEENRLAEQAKKAEEIRLAEEAKKQEEIRLAEQAKKAEEIHLAEQAKKQEEIRLAEEAKKQEEAEVTGLIQEAKKAGETHLAEQVKKAEEIRLAEEAKLQPSIVQNPVVSIPQVVKKSSPTGKIVVGMIGLAGGWFAMNTKSKFDKALTDLNAAASKADPDNDGIIRNNNLYANYKIAYDVAKKSQNSSTIYAGLGVAGVALITEIVLMARKPKSRISWRPMPNLKGLALRYDF